MANRVVAPVRGCACALLFASLGVASVTPNIVLSSNLPSPQPVGTLVTFTATVAGGPVGTKYDYQFSVGSPGKQFEIRLDFGPKSKFAWAQNDSEGTFTIRAVVRNRSATPSAVYGPVTVDYVVAARVPLNGPSAGISNRPPVSGPFQYYAVRPRQHQARVVSGSGLCRFGNDERDTLRGHYYPQLSRSGNAPRQQI